MNKSPKNRIKRFSPVQRIFHLGLMIAFLFQGATGLGRLYIETSWGKRVAWIFGGYDSCLSVHKYVGIFMICWFGLHLIYLLFVIYRMVKSLIMQREKQYPEVLYPSEISKRYPLPIKLVAGMIRLQIRLLLFGLYCLRIPMKFYGPDSLLPRLEDLGQAVHHVAWMLRIDWLLRFDRWGLLKKVDLLLIRVTRSFPLARIEGLKKFDGLLPMIKTPPQFDRWGYWEKFDYWAVFWGIPILGTTGLLLAYPLLASRIMPGWGLNVVLWIHRIEAILAMTHIFIIHFFIAHLRRHSFPMDRGMFEGSTDMAGARHEKPAWIARLEQSGKLQNLLVPQASNGFRVLIYVFGYAAMAIGVFLLIGGLVNSPYITW